MRTFGVISLGNVRKASGRGATSPSVSSKPIGRVLIHRPGLMVVKLEGRLLILEAKGMVDLKPGDPVRVQYGEPHERSSGERVDARLIAEVETEGTNVENNPQRMRSLMEIVSIVGESKLPPQMKERILSALKLDPPPQLAKRELDTLRGALKSLAKMVASTKPFPVFEFLGSAKTLGERTAFAFSTPAVIGDAITDEEPAPSPKREGREKVFLVPSESRENVAARLLRSITVDSVEKPIAPEEVSVRISNVVSQKTGEVHVFPGLVILEVGREKEAFSFEDVEVFNSFHPLIKEGVGRSDSTSKNAFPMAESTRIDVATVSEEGSNRTITVVANDELLKQVVPLLERIERESTLQRSVPLEARVVMLVEKLIESGNRPRIVAKAPRGWTVVFETERGRFFTVRVEEEVPRGREVPPRTVSRSPLVRMGFVELHGISNVEKEHVLRIVEDLFDTRSRTMEALGENGAKTERVRVSVKHDGRIITVVYHSKTGGKPTMVFHGSKLDLAFLSKYPSVHLRRPLSSNPRLPKHFVKIKLRGQVLSKRVFPSLRNRRDGGDVAKSVGRVDRNQAVTPRHFRSPHLSRSSRIFSLVRSALESPGPEDRARTEPSESEGCAVAKTEDTRLVERVHRLLEKRLGSLDGRDRPASPDTVLSDFFHDGVRFMCLPEVGIRELWIRRWNDETTGGREERYTIYLNVESRLYGRVEGLIESSPLHLDVTLGIERGLERVRTAIPVLEERLSRVHLSSRIRVMVVKSVESSRFFRRERRGFDVYA